MSVYDTGWRQRQQAMLDRLERNKDEIFRLADMCDERNATIKALRAELAEEHREFVAAEDKVISACGRARRAEAALTRVGELLDGIVDRMGSYDHYVPPTAEDIFAIRAAIEGEQQ